MERMNMHPPKGASGFWMGTYYKLDKHNRLYYWDGEWRSSSLKADEFVKQMSAKKCRFNFQND
ncbi:hypothetical protein [Endozoicomonas atrinae]|uniref:hypothetical protein n=1 Tax=Endozoicomonas atrinae TaxID=1333660 RepID=UPI003B00B077